MKLFLLGLLPLASAHMGISSPRPLDRAVGDAYRYPVSAGNSPMSGGACHGRTDGATYAWVWTPVSSGQCEIYQNCFTSKPGLMKMSGGASHNGGPCKLYKCTGTITIPHCERLKLPDRFGNCEVVATYDDCTTKGEFVVDDDGGSPAPPPSPTAPPPPTAQPTMAPGQRPTPSPTFNPNVSPDRVRCGTSTQDAASRCGKQCKGDHECTEPGEKCFPALPKCDDNEIVPPPTPAPTVPDAAKCVSKHPWIMDAWCEWHGCNPKWDDYCGRLGTAELKVSKQASTVTVPCQMHSVYGGQTLADVAVVWDSTEKELLDYNKELNHITTAADVKDGLVLHIPGDCQTAKKQAAVDGTSTDASSASTVGVTFAATVAAAVLMV